MDPQKTLAFFLRPTEPVPLSPICNSLSLSSKLCSIQTIHTLTPNYPSPSLQLIHPQLTDRSSTTGESKLLLLGTATPAMEVLPCGVYRRSTTGKLFFEMRIADGKLYCTQIKSSEEGGLCHDIARRYCSDSLATNTAKRKAPQDSLFNYPEYSASLVLEDLPVEFNNAVRENKERVMALILKQAQAAAKALPKRERRAAESPRAKVQKHSGQDVGSPSQKNAYSPSKEPLDSAVDYRKNDSSKKFLDDVCEHVNQCKVEYELKVIERVELERKVKDIKEDSGFISFQKSGSEKFHEHMACFKQLVSSDGKSGSSLLKACEQEYMSEEHKCCKLRKILEGHNLKSIPESLMGDGNTMTGRQRANEKERLPLVLEIFPTAEKNSCSMPTEVSAFCAPPTSALVLERFMPYGKNDNAMPSSTTLACEPRMESLRAESGDSTVESDMSQVVASFEFALGDQYTNEEVQKFWSSLVDNSTHTGYRREDEDERPPEQYSANSNVEVRQFHDHWSPDWTDTLFLY